MFLQKKDLVKAAFVGSIAIFGIGCEQPKDDNGTSTGPVSFKMQGTQPGSLTTASLGSLSTNPTIDLRDRSGTVVGSIVIDYAKVVVQEVEIEISLGGGAGEIDFAGPFVIDLLTNTMSPEPPNIQLPVATYNEVWLGFDTLTSESATALGIVGTDPIVGNTFVVEGFYTGPSASGALVNAPFSLAVTRDEGMDLTGSNDTSEGMSILENRLNDVIVAFRMGKWFDFSQEFNWDNVEPSQIVPDSGEVNLDEASTGANSQIFEFLIVSMLESADYGIDEDDDGELDVDEDDDPDAEDAEDD